MFSSDTRINAHACTRDSVLVVFVYVNHEFVPFIENFTPALNIQTYTQF
jgi:hypothetical protein